MMVTLDGKPTMWFGTDGRLHLDLPTPDDTVTVQYPGADGFGKFLADLQAAYLAACERKVVGPPLFNEAT